MGKSEKCGQRGFEIANPVRHSTFAENGLLRVAADEKSQLQPGKSREQARAPARGAFRPRRSVAAARDAGIAEPHGDDGEFARVVEFGRPDTHPFAQSLSGRVVERDAGGMSAAAGRLTRDEDSRVGVRLEQGRGAERQHVGACATGAHLGKQGFQPLHPTQVVSVRDRSSPFSGRSSPTGGISSPKARGRDGIAGLPGRSVD